MLGDVVQLSAGVRDLEAAVERFPESHGLSGELRHRESYDESHGACHGLPDCLR